MADNKALPSIEDLMKALDEHKEQTAQKIAELQLENAKLKGALVEEKDNPHEPVKPPVELVEYKNKKYRFTAGKFTIPGEIPLSIKSEEAALDETIIAKILAIPGQGILKEQV